MGNKLKEKIIMDKCYWREIYGRGDGEGKVFQCRCNIDDETCEALRLFLEDKYKFLTITTEIPKDGEYDTYKKHNYFHYNPNIE